MTRGLIHHIELYVSNVERSTRFWGWLLESLGYEQHQQWTQGCSWKLENTYIVFVQVEERFLQIPYHQSRVGMNHLAFHAESRAHVDELTKALQEKGVSILYKERHPFAGGPHHYAVYFEGPDRIKVELVAPGEEVSCFQ